MLMRKEVASKLEEDGIEFILAQFVDITGAAKVKMIPVNTILRIYFRRM